MARAEQRTFLQSSCSPFQKALTFADYQPLSSPKQPCLHLLPSRISSDPEWKFYTLLCFSDGQNKAAEAKRYANLKKED